MKINALPLRIAGAVALGLCALGPAAAEAPLRVGVAVVDVTPPVPYRMSGYFNERLSTGVMDPLHVKAIVLQQGEQSAALAFCDLIGVPRRVSRQARQAASQATGIPVENIVVAATHSHTGPLYFDSLRDHLHARSVERHGSDPYEQDDYPAMLGKRIAETIAQAFAERAPAALHAGFAREDRLAFNRRYHMRDGSVRFNPGIRNPDILRPAGPIDPQVGVIAISPEGRQAPSAAIVSYALHLDTLQGTEYSPDYPHAMEQRLRERFGDDFTALFATGACGDINHIDVSGTVARRAPEIGRLLGDTVTAALEGDGLRPISQPALAVRSSVIEAPVEKYRPDEIAAARAKMDLLGAGRLPFLDEVKAYSIVASQEFAGDTLPLEVQVFRLDADTAIVTLPAEIFVELGLAIKAASPFKTTLVVELANDAPGYIPTKKAFAEGSYETINSRVKPGAGERLVEEACRLLEELK